VCALPTVVEVLDVSGPWDYEVRVRFRLQRELYEVTSALRSLPGVVGMETRTVLREVLVRGGMGPRSTEIEHRRNTSVGSL
jgi:DNA-binding Lrp family transcriptional regulator